MLRHRISVGRHHIQRIFPIGGLSYSQWLTENFPDADRWDHQDISGSSVLEASYTTAATAPDTRNVVSQVFADYSVANGGWSDGGSEVASCDGTQPGISDLSVNVEDAIGRGKPFLVTFTCTVSAGTVTPLVNGVPGTVRASSDTYVELITASGIGVRTGFRASIDFVGTVDLKIYTVKQTGILASSAYPLPEQVTNGSFDTDVSSWNEGATGTFEWVAGVGRLTLNSGTDSANANQAPGLVEGVRQIVSGRFMAPSSNTISNAATISMNAAGATAGDGTSAQVTAEDVWQDFEFEFVPGATELTIYLFVLDRGVAWGAAGDVAYFDDISIRPVNPMNGDTVVATVGVPTNFGSLGLSVVDDGATSFSAFLSAALNSKFNPAAGFINIWGKVSGVGVHTDGTARRLIYLFVDSSNRISITKPEAVNSMQGFIVSGGIVEIITVAFTSLDWAMFTVTWKKPGNFVFYINGVSVGTPQAIANLLAGNLEDAIIGATSTTPTDVWDGPRTRYMLGYEQPTDAQVLLMYNQGRR